MTRRTARRTAPPDPRRVLSLFVIGLSLTALLVAGVEVHGSARAAYAGRKGSAALLPVAPVARSAAVVWNCPGPLEASSAHKPAILLENPSSRPSTVRLDIAATAVGGGRPEHVLAPHGIVLPVPAHSSARSVLSAGGANPGHRRTHGVAVYEAVSVTATGAPLTVVEQLPTGRGTVASACVPGSAAAGYEAAGVTTGSSSLDLALFDPTAAPAVVDVSVGTGNGPVLPAVYQGVSLNPGSLFVLHVARYVPLRAEVAVAARATVGRFVLGTLSSVDAQFVTSRLGPAHSYLVTAGALLGGLGRPLRHFVMPYGLAGASDAEAVRLYDPGNRPALVRVGSASAHVSVTVLPGHTLSEALPVSAGRTAGTVTVSSDVGIVCTHETYVTSSQGHVQLISAPVLSAESGLFVIPAAPGVAQRGVIVLSTAGDRRVTVDVERAPAPGRGAVLLNQRVLRPGRETVVPLGNAAVGTLEVKGNGRFTMGGFLVSASGGRSPLPAVALEGSE